jgi:hypothetical protein
LLIIITLTFVSSFAIGQTTYNFTAYINSNENWEDPTIWSVSPSGPAYPGDTGYSGYNAGDSHEVYVESTSTNRTRTIKVNQDNLSGLVDNVTIKNSSSRTLRFDINDNNFRIKGNLSGDGEVRIGRKELQIGGALSIGTLTQETGTVNFNGSGTQSAQAYTYYNLVLSGSGVYYLGGPSTVTSDFYLASGVLNSTDVLYLDGTVTCGAGTMNGTSGTVFLASGNAAPQGTYFNLTTTGTASLCGDVTVNGQLNLASNITLGGSNLTIGLAQSLGFLARLTLWPMVRVNLGGCLPTECLELSIFLWVTQLYIRPWP